MTVLLRSAPTLVPFALKDAPSFIEAQFPVGRVSAEAYKERKAIHGQILTSLGSYWKGRKPLLLVRATILGCLLPATDNSLKDLEVFLALMGMDDEGFNRRIKNIKPSDIDPNWVHYNILVSSEPKIAWNSALSRSDRNSLAAEWLSTLPYAKRLTMCYRPDEIPQELSVKTWAKVNEHLGTSAISFPNLIEQLGFLRYGHRPKVGDTFSGGGSIPFEAARIGCEAHASDLNPIACMLSWGAFRIIGADDASSQVIQEAQRTVSNGIIADFNTLGIEKDKLGRQAKAYLYCVEVICPKTGYLVPVAPSWIISRNHRTIAKLTPCPIEKRYEIDIISDVSDQEILAAETGTLVDDRLVHPMNPDADGVSLSVIRGDHRNAENINSSKLRRWQPNDILPDATDIYQERLYCIQWLKDAANGKIVSDSDLEELDESEDNGRGSFFAAPTSHDIENENKVSTIVSSNITSWQRLGLIPNDVIERGEKTDEPIRTRGWTYWHHLYTPRHLLFGSIAQKHISGIKDDVARAALLVGFCRSLNYMSRLTQWMVRTPSPKKPADVVNHVFYNQALNTFFNFGARASVGLLPSMAKPFPKKRLEGQGFVECKVASDVSVAMDIFITDPPYADAVAYHEITEYFLSWAKTIGQKALPQFVWDSRRALAIKGVDERFRAEMISAYKAMTHCLPDNGMQVVMFTHQDAGVWADLASIMWAAGLRVTAAWNVITETESSTKKGNYVKGTIILVLRKRLARNNVKRMDIEGLIETEVDKQLGALIGLDDDWTSENLYTDGDLQLAAYAAALRVITNFETIDRRDVGADVYRKLARNEKSVVKELIEYAASVANSKLVPDAFPKSMWRDLDVGSRFYVRMLDMEAKGSSRFADYQDFARTFSFNDYAKLMGSTKANGASLAGAAGLRGTLLGSEGFGSSPLRRVLFATYKTMQKDDPKEGLAFLKTEYGPDYWNIRLKLVSLAKYISLKTTKTRPEESQAADLIGQRLEVDRL